MTFILGVKYKKELMSITILILINMPTAIKIISNSYHLYSTNHRPASFLWVMVHCFAALRFTVRCRLSEQDKFIFFSRDLLNLSVTATVTKKSDSN